MKLVLFGYGKMGKMVEQQAIAQNDQIVLVVSSANQASIGPTDLAGADVAIDFSVPSAVLNHAHSCFAAGIPVVIGTTGWYDRLDEVKQACAHYQGAAVYGSNFSTAMNLVFFLNRMLAQWMNHLPDYLPSIQEIHHKQKRDSPSGTALILAQDIISRIHRLQRWMPANEAKASDLPIESLRTDDAVGEHRIRYTSSDEQIILQHTAWSRKVFAAGALTAARWIMGRKGFYSYADLFADIESTLC